MKLLKEIDKLAKVQNFQLFLEDLKELDPVDMEDELVTECITAKMEVLKEMGRGDYSSHMDMARSAGYKGGMDTDPNVQAKLEPKRRLGLQPSAGEGPQKGELVRVNGKTYRLEDTDGRIAFLGDPKNNSPFGGEQLKIKVSDLKPIKTKSGKMAWIHIGN